MTHFKSIYTFVCLLTILCGESWASATQVRAVWLATNYQLDWGKNANTAEEQKRHLCNILDDLQQLNFNTVLFQVRLRGSVLFRSQYEPMSHFVKTRCTDGTFFDPLAFAVAECHKRGMECHAWLVTYPVGKQGNTSSSLLRRIRAYHPEILKSHHGELYLDPGVPATNDYLLRLVEEIVDGYDVDGIHFDYIRYPDDGASFPDKSTFFRYGDGSSLSEWRRANITRFVGRAYDSVKRQKPWVQVSSSPIGVYRPLLADRTTWSGYESVYQDAHRWLQLGIQDAVYPMLYYSERLFYPHAQHWMANANGRLIVPGLGVYKMLPSEQNWSLQTIENKQSFLRQNTFHGEAFFRYEMIRNNVKGIRSVLSKRYREPAKLPPLFWLSTEKPSPPLNVEITPASDGNIYFKWQPANKEDVTYTIYRFSITDKISFDSAKSILVTRLKTNRWSYRPTERHEGHYYVVTATNRFHNESETSEVHFAYPMN